MAKYVVLDSKTETFEPSYKLPIVNLLAALVCSIAFMQKVFPSVDGMKSLLMGVVFIIIYYCVCLIPLCSIVPAVVSGIIYAVMFLALADKIGSDVIRFIVKALILIIDVFIEFMVIVNSTLRWLQYKFPVKPKVRVLSDKD